MTKPIWAVWRVVSPTGIQSLPPACPVEADEAKDIEPAAGKIKKPNKNAGKIRKSKPHRQ